MKQNFLPNSLRQAMIEAQRAKRERWFTASIAKPVVEPWGIWRAHFDPEIRRRMLDLESATIRLCDAILERYEAAMLLGRDDAKRHQTRMP